MIATVSLKDVLLESVKEVFETMVFMALEEVPEASLASDEPRRAAALRGTTSEEPALLGTITFKGHLEGCLGICCGQSGARAVAASMLGMGSDEELRPGDVSDAVGEIANMVLGTVKSRIHKEVGGIEVSIPSVVEGRALRSTLGEGTKQVRVRVSIDEEHIAELFLLYREGR